MTIRQALSVSAKTAMDVNSETASEHLLAFLHKNEMIRNLRSCINKTFKSVTLLQEGWRRHNISLKNRMVVINGYIWNLHRDLI